MGSIFDGKECVFVHSPSHNVGEGIMFLGDLSAAYLLTDLVTTISHEQLEQS